MKTLPKGLGWGWFDAYGSQLCFLLPELYRVAIEIYSEMAQMRNQNKEITLERIVLASSF